MEQKLLAKWTYLSVEILPGEDLYKGEEVQAHEHMIFNAIDERFK